MGTLPDALPKVVFGPFEYDEAAGSLLKHGTAIRLQGKPLKILSLLVSRTGQIVSRDELRQYLWEGTTFVDFEQGLNSAVNKLRQALGDSADQPRYVETLPGRGYRFVAPIQRASTLALLEMPAPRVESQRQRPHQTGLFVTVGLALAGVAGASYWLGQRSTKPAGAPGAVRFAVLPPIGFALEGAASRQSFALSPDGTRLAFTAMDSSGDFSLFLRDLNSLEPHLVPRSDGAHTLFWQPDGRSLYFTARGQLWRTPLQGDANVLLGDSPSFMFSGIWLSPKRMLLDSFRGSYLVSPSGGPLEQLNQNYMWPQMLPDGEHVLCVRWDSGAGRHRAQVLRLSNFSPTRDLMETDSRVMYSPPASAPGTGYLLYVRGGNLLAQPFDPGSFQVGGEAALVASRVYSFAKTGAADFSVSPTGTLAYTSYVSRSQLVWVDRSGNQAAAIGPANINVKSARLSPDGRRLATAIYDVERGQQDIWIFDVKTNTGRRLAAEPALRDAPVWSPDSKSLAFLYQADGGPPKVHVRRLGENDQDEEMPAADFQMPIDWSPDGRYLAYVNTGFPRSANETQGDVWVFDMARGRKPIPLLNTPFHEANPAFSPDGNWLAFTSNESGRPEVYVQAFRSGDAPGVTGERHLVSTAGAVSAVRWRRDGKELFYLGVDGRVLAVPIRLSGEPDFGPATPLFAISTEARAVIHSLPGFDVYADGSRFVIVKAPESPSLVVIQNWQALLPGKR